MPRIYYDKRGNYRGGSMSGKEGLFWNSAGGFAVWACFMLVAWAFFLTAAVVRSKLKPTAKLLTVAALWGAIVLVAVIVGNGSSSGGGSSHPASSSINWYGGAPCYGSGVQSVDASTRVQTGGVYSVVVTCNDGTQDTGYTR